MTKTTPNINDELISFELPSSITSTVLNSLISESAAAYKNLKNLFDRIELDFSKVKYIDPEGALSLISFCAAIKDKNPNTIFSFIYPQDDVLFYLASIGFFGQMSSKVGVIDRQDIVHYENELRQKRRKKQRQPTTSEKLKPIILPIETIPKRHDTIARDFENVSGSFVNHAISTFEELFETPHFNLCSTDQKRFLLSNRELYKNIFEHSQSWGIALIHARPNYGTSVCVYDIGVGFRRSVAKFNSDLKSIEWALVDGNSSNNGTDNDGFGLTIVQDFVLNKGGIIKIRSGECLIEITSKSKKNYRVNKFLGVQMSYFIPSLN